MYMSSPVYYMGRYFILFTLLAGVQGGPYIWRPRPVAKSPVAVAQWQVHDRLLVVEKDVLQTSLGLARLAESVTSQAYRLTYEAEARMEAIRGGLQQEARVLRPLAPGCVDMKTVQLRDEELSNVTERMYQCTHGVSDLAASFEVGLTEVLINARAQIWNVQQAMWFCEKYQPQVDRECVTRLVEEGLEVSTLLPGRGRRVRDRAEAAGAHALDRLSECLSQGISVAEEKALSLSQDWRQCLQDH